LKLTLATPLKLYIDHLDGIRLSEIRESLTYRDKKVQYELQKHKHASWFERKYGEDAYQKRMEELKAQEKICLLNQDPDGRYWVMSGMRGYLENKYGLTTEVLVRYPEPRLMPWSEVPNKTPYPYQENARAALLARLHARVEMGTGLGKSFILLNICRELGLKTVIMAPSTSIADQLFQDFVKHLGKKHVGAFYDGKKDFKKLIVIGNAQSFTRVEPGSPAWEAMSKAQVFMADESHQCPAATLSRVCSGLLADAPYRFFFSATQMRNDGLDKLLDAITGPTVYSMTVREGVDQGYLSKPVFRMIRTRSDANFASDDANEMTREHLYRNRLVLAQAAEVINQSVEHLGHQVLVLIDEVEQFTLLRPLLNHKVGFAHGPLTATTYKTDDLGNQILGRDGYPVVKTKGNRDSVPREYWESDPNDLVAQFNAGEFPILVGTSCISTGTDIRSVKTMVYLKGGKSEIEVKQGVGRCTRKVPGKNACSVVDFDVANVAILSKHAKARKAIFDDIYGPVQVVDWGSE
jgi:superfamily II DNA or RNA helicase